MMRGLFNGDPSTAIISCYSPNNASDETNIINFYMSDAFPNTTL